MTENAIAPDPTTDPAAETKPPKKRAAKKAAAAPPAPEQGTEKKDSRSLYLPALPEGFEYTSITATGPTGETINIGPAGENDATGSASLTFEGAGLNRSQNYADMKSAIAAGAKAAKAMAKIAEREAELAKVREEAFDL